MNAFDDVFRRTRTITFDCYGTLIDWEAGLRRSLGEILGEIVTARPMELFEAYVRTEAEVESGAYQSYREVLASVVERLARQFKVDLPPERANALAEMLPNWAPFADTKEALRRLERRYRLGVLSNIDRELFARTARQFDVDFDFVVTAEDVQSYKPGLPHFRCLIEHHGGREDVVHVAQSLFHDGAPARELGLPFVWINRYGEERDASTPMLGEFADLGSFADAACDG